MKILGIVGFFLSLSLLTSCTTPFYQHYEVCGTLNGKIPYSGGIVNSPLDGQAKFYVNSFDGKTRCSGTMIPSYQDNITVTCDKAQGSVVLQCVQSDTLFYTQMNLYWAAGDCASGTGYGYSDAGDIFYFSFYPPHYYH